MAAHRSIVVTVPKLADDAAEKDHLNMSSPVRCLLISDFNIEPFQGNLENDEDFPLIEATTAPFGQVVPSLRGALGDLSGTTPDHAVVWTQPDSIVPSFKSVLNYQSVDVDRVLEEVDEYCRLLIAAQDHLPSIFLPTWVMPPLSPAQGMLAMKNGFGATNLLMRMNLRLAENLDGVPNICLLDAQNWVSRAGQNAFSSKLWYMGKVAFGNDVFKAAATDIKAALRGLSGDAKKLVIVDLDNTMWGGNVGDVGWQGLNLGGHNALGEAFVDFQRALKSLTRRGIVLGIASKNTESVALEAFENHSEMILSIDDFAGWRINWQDKAQNILDLVTELNLGLQHTVFIDDNPVERARVREALPEVTVPEWPGNAMFYRGALLDLPYFDTPAISREDLDRSKMYAAERKRKVMQESVESLDDWLMTLEITVKVEELNDGNLQRAAQLLNKTNQMNLSTRRLTEAELRAWAGQEDHKVWTFRVADKFGDAGLTGLMSMQGENGAGQIVDFVLSCRVIGRKVEETMFHTAVCHAKSIGLDEVRAGYIATARNEPCLIFLNQSGFTRAQDTDTFVWKTERDYDAPEAVTIQFA